MTQKAAVCGRTLSYAGKADICAEPPRHEGEHVGKHTGIRWTTGRRGTAPVVKDRVPGGSYIDQPTGVGGDT